MAAALLGVAFACFGMAWPAAAADGPRAAAMSSALQEATGHTSSQLAPRPACGARAGTTIRCYAQVLTVRSTGRPAALLHVPSAKPMATASGALPFALSGVTPATSPAPGAYTADFLQWAYDTMWLSANRGASDTVAIVDAYGDPSAYSDMEKFRSANGLPPLPQCGGAVTSSCFELVNQNGATSPLPGPSGGWDIEESLDIDAVSSLCPLCKILMVEANSGSPSDLATAVSTAASRNVDQISMSWGGDVPADYAGNSSPYSSITGSAMFAASGDSSYPGPAVGYPAALPYVTAVGGTTLTSDSTASRGFDESAWSRTESGCDTSQSQPSYQSGVTTQCTGRAYADISADANPKTGLAIYDTQNYDPANSCGGWCLVGGTSPATPLVAAYHALTGLSDKTPTWTYSYAPRLNDIISGSDGTCPSNQLVICTAGTGWDGPTGNGSINGELTTGGPGIGGTFVTGPNASDVTLSGGLYPNRATTSYYWQYWVNGQSPATAVSTPSPAATVTGSTLQPVSNAVCGLTPSTTYDYDLVASNSAGSETGYQASFTTAATESKPTTVSIPQINGATVTGQILTGSVAWKDAICNLAPSFAWQESSSSGGTWTTVGSAQTYALDSADAGQYLRFTATESNSAGSTTVTSSVVGPITVPPPPVMTTKSTTTTPATTTTTTVNFYRCAQSCVLIATNGATSYRPQRADYGRYIKIMTAVTTITGGPRTTNTTTRWVGPITARTAGVLTVGRGATIASTSILRGSTGTALAQIRIARRTKRAVILLVRRQSRAATQIWAYVVSNGAAVSCTTARRLRNSLALTVPLKPGQTLKLVAVAT